MLKGHYKKVVVYFQSILVLLMLFLTVGCSIKAKVGNRNSEFYDSHQFSFKDSKPNSMNIQSYECLDSSCNKVRPANVKYYKGDAIICMNNFLLNKKEFDVALFESCIKDYEITGNILYIHDCKTITNDCSGNVALFIKYNTNTDFGYLNYFLTEGDTYIPKLVRVKDFNCEYDTCVDNTAPTYEFIKINNGFADIGPINITNTENPLLPVRIEVSNICSALRRLAEPGMYPPQFLPGYSDYNADTKISLYITQTSNGSQLFAQEVTIPITTDLCDGLVVFKWTPPAELKNEEVKFRIEADVIDGQFLRSTKDWHEVIKVIYPENIVQDN